MIIRKSGKSLFTLQAIKHTEIQDAFIYQYNKIDILVSIKGSKLNKLRIHLCTSTESYAPIFFRLLLTFKMPN